MPTTGLTELVEPMSARILALEALVYAIADTCPDRAALRSAFDVYAAGTEAKMNGLPVGDRYLELLRDSMDHMRAVIDQA